MSELERMFIVKLTTEKSIVILGNCYLVSIVKVWLTSFLNKPGSKNHQIKNLKKSGCVRL